MDIILASLLLKNMSHVSFYISKIESMKIDPKKSKTGPILCGLKGLVNLDHGNYKAAANHFLEVQFGMDLGQVRAPSIFTHTHVLQLFIPRDVAVYGGLCALASLDRSELKQRVFSNAQFKQFLEDEPGIKDILVYFYDSKYKEFVKALEKLRVISFVSRFGRAILNPTFT